MLAADQHVASVGVLEVDVEQEQQPEVEQPWVDDHGGEAVLVSLSMMKCRASVCQC